MEGPEGQAPVSDEAMSDKVMSDEIKRPDIKPMRPRLAASLILTRTVGGRLEPRAK